MTPMSCQLKVSGTQDGGKTTSMLLIVSAESDRESKRRASFHRPLLIFFLNYLQLKPRTK